MATAVPRAAVVRALERARARTVGRQGRLFGFESGTGLYGPGGGSELVGRKLSALDPGRIRPLRVELEHAGAYQAVDLRSRYIPGLVSAGSARPEARLRAGPRWS